MRVRQSTFAIDGCSVRRMSADAVRAPAAEARPGWFRLWWDAHFSGFSRGEACALLPCRTPGGGRFTGLLAAALAVLRIRRLSVGAVLREQ